MEIRTPQALGAAVRGERLKMRLTQASLAKSAGVSRPWLTQFEAGKPTVELGRVLAVIAALGIVLELRTSEPAASSDRPDPIDLDSVLDQYEEDHHDHG
ncbi:helix-turn-helix domain-containing protein [Kribbella sp. NPDC056861]|uniref:helix-turn-helix domain-containing protein n=1 Tax=Kribbella sp. NPDC056861 TaxID=3154857 RepID=UPI00342C7F00